MKLIKYILLVIALISLNMNRELNAQIDTVFWFAPPWVTPDHSQNVPIQLRISSLDAPANVRIQLPLAGYDQSFLVAANSLLSVPLTAIVNDLESKPADAVLTSGMKITSNSLITVVYDFISAGFNPETYSLKGNNGIGTEFITPFQTIWENRTLNADQNGDGVVTQPKQYFSIVATEDNTTISIRPNANVEGGHPAGVTYSVNLPLAGNVYTCQNVTLMTRTPGNSLSGSIVVSDKPVSVTINDDSVRPSSGGCFDLMGDQIVPTDVIGTDYIINKGRLNAADNESAFIVAAKNFTTVTINDGTVTSVILNQGETYQYKITSPLTFITSDSDKPIYVVHASGFGCELGIAIIPPLNCAGSDQVSFPRNNADPFFLNLLCRAGSEGDFTLNTSSTLIPATAFSAVPGTGGLWMGAQIEFSTAQIASGSANLIENSNSTDSLFSLGIFNGTGTGGCLYHYMSSFVRRVNIDAGADKTVCSGGEITIDLEGKISGGSTSGSWSVVSGTGTFGSSSNTLINTYTPTVSDINSGELRFALESTGNCLPEYDTLVVTFAQSPEVTAGLDQSFCSNNVGEILVTGTSQFSVGSEWYPRVPGGSFANKSDLSTSYTPSSADLLESSIQLILKSEGSLSGCPEITDTIEVFLTAPPSVSAGPNIVACASQDSVLVAGTVTGASSTGIWSTSGSGTFSPSELDPSTYYLISAADITAGLVTLSFTSTNNGACLSVTDNLTLNILDKPEINITTPDAVCENTLAIVLDGSATAGYITTWSVNGFGLIADQNAIPSDYTFDPADFIGGEMWVFMELSGGLCDDEKDSSLITFVEEPIISAGIDQEYCSNEEAPVEAIPSGSATNGTWGTRGTGSFTQTPPSLTSSYIPSLSDISNGSVELFVTSDAAFGCTADEDDITITFKSIPTAEFSFTTACEVENVFFTDESTTPSGTIESWSYDFGDLLTSIANNPIHPYASSGSFITTLIVKNSENCFDTVMNTVYVSPVPDVSMNYGYICQGAEAQFSSNASISFGRIDTYQWEFNEGEANSTDQNPLYTFNNAGSFPINLTVTSDSGCTASLTENIEVRENPAADFNTVPETALALEDIVYTDASIGGPFTNWIWDFGDGTGGNKQNEIHQYAVGGAYSIRLEVTDTTGCKADTIKSLKVSLLPVLPTAFTPNGDGENDVFIIRGGPFGAVNFQIYNNWGERIFISEDATVGWDGTYKGKDSPLGVYTWTFTVSLGKERTVTKEGDITLIR